MPTYSCGDSGETAGLGSEAEAYSKESKPVFIQCKFFVIDECDKVFGEI